MVIKIGINGFGRIGRTIFRSLLNSNSQEFELVHINDLAPGNTLAHLAQYDSTLGPAKEEMSFDNNKLYTSSFRPITHSQIASPKDIPWNKSHVDIVFECTGLFSKREKAEEHLKAGAPKVLISAPGTDEDLTVVCGVNDHQLKKDHKIVSNASCTTNCLAPLAQTLHNNFEIISGLMTTVHAYTNDQVILDASHKDLRRARTAGVNMIPTSTGAAKAIGLVIPELKGKIDGLAIRVPTSNVSLVDLTVLIKKSTTVLEINNALEKSSQEELKGILGFTKKPLVSSDFCGSTLSSCVDSMMTKVIHNNQVKVLAWYDNEMGFSSRMLDVARKMVKK